MEGLVGLLLVSVVTAVVIGLVVLLFVHVIELDALDFGGRERGSTVPQGRGEEPSTPTSHTSQRRRMIEATAFLGFWMAIGFLRRISPVESAANIGLEYYGRLVVVEDSVHGTHEAGVWCRRRGLRVGRRGFRPGG